MSMSEVLDDQDIFSDIGLRERCSSSLVRPDDSISNNNNNNTPTKTTDFHEEIVRKLEIPANPKHWSPTSLSLYLGHVLSNKTGGTFPDPVVRDIQLVIIRERMNGKSFLHLTEEDLVKLGINPIWRPKFLSQAYRLRQKVVRGQIVGFDEDGSPSASPPCTKSETSKGSSKSTPSPRGSKIYQERQQQVTTGTKDETGWIGRALLGTPSPTRSRLSGEPNPSYRLNQSFGSSSVSRVRGMVASYERSLGSDSASSCSDTGDEADDEFFDKGRDFGSSLTTYLEISPKGTVDDATSTTLVVSTGVENDQMLSGHSPDSIVQSNTSSRSGYITPDSASLSTSFPEHHDRPSSPLQHLGEDKSGHLERSLPSPTTSSASSSAAPGVPEPTMETPPFITGSRAPWLAKRPTKSRLQFTSPLGFQARIGISRHPRPRSKICLTQLCWSRLLKKFRLLMLKPLSHMTVRLLKLSHWSPFLLWRSLHRLRSCESPIADAENQTVNPYRFADKGTQCEAQRRPKPPKAQSPTIPHSSDELPSNFSQYVLAASLGIVVVIAQTIFKRLMVKRS
ncbi:uncharacterized protein EI90DRAFT_3037286 [Cantharellus anzutake]|uniref:uncharacterized protein n=1 Tax=Cantharellus anzutake TaxID=1750568 RepID=UPI001904AC27|nr:uncharacterized protein EI90DRAFT_3037286 [Cantharellus anzutake]KAF8339630.1 hypothetical protein EI90DRAFT_3037286 [Cantharellus anzutake]